MNKHDLVVEEIHGVDPTFMSKYQADLEEGSR